MADLKLARFNPEPCNFPRPQIAFLPTSSRLGLARSGASKSAHKSTFRHFTRGRYALGEAYRLAGVGREGALLAPAYHCVTMLDPALNLGAAIHLYPLNADLSPDLTQLEELLASLETPVKALLATHFFGLAKDFSQLKQWCEKHRINLIEDCSHVLFTQNYQAQGTGTYGQFVASSPYKFFACHDGGLLHSPEAHQLLTVQTEPANLIDELRGIKHGIDKYRATTSVGTEIERIDERLHALSLMPLVRAREYITSYSEPSSQFSPVEIKKSSLRSSRLIVRVSSIEENARRRRSNYERWLEAVSDLPNCQPLSPALPRHCIPYMFPLRINNPDPHFYWLRHLGVPIWRWDEMAVSNCPVAQDYRFHLLHLPCHQSLTDDQMEWMIATVQKTLKCPAKGCL